MAIDITYIFQSEGNHSEPVPDEQQQCDIVSSVGWPL